MITAEIAGYTFNTDRMCPDCLRRWVGLQLMDVGYWQQTDKTTESLLDTLAMLKDIDREYVDANDFPVPFSGQQAQTEASWAAYDGDDAPCCDGDGCHNEFTGEF